MGKYIDFKNFDIITPNEREARFSLGDQDPVIRPLAKKLFEKSNCKNLLLKCGEKGIIVYRKSNKNLELDLFLPLIVLLKMLKILLELVMQC